jgi:hypothetical protein
LVFGGLFNNGSPYSGDWKEGVGAHGIGTCYDLDGEPVYEGEWKDGERDGFGKVYL